VLVLVAGSVASAHDERFSTSNVEIKPNEVRWRWMPAWRASKGRAASGR
jgi:hypothetical protein